VLPQTDSDERAAIGRIPVRNLWLLMLYASDVARFHGNFKMLVESDSANLPDLVAKLLVSAIEQRLKRGLTHRFLPKARILTRIRGRIDMLTTETHQLLERGEVACRFDELSVNTVRNRYVRAAISYASRIVAEPALSQRCRGVARDLVRCGVTGDRPAREDLAIDPAGRNDAVDAAMIALASLIFDLGLPTEDSGNLKTHEAEREERWVRKLFERAVGGFYRSELRQRGWIIRCGEHMKWQVAESSAGLHAILPGMVTDILLDAPDSVRRIVIDTKFAAILATGQYGKERLKSGYLYQLYAYLRTQEGAHERWRTAEGILLHPAIGSFETEHALIQGHRMTFATVDLASDAESIRRGLRHIIEPTVSA
jgi:5-methylcytosine-specific restriction enzyme subunit McrC